MLMLDLSIEIFLPSIIIKIITRLRRLFVDMGILIGIFESEFLNRTAAPGIEEHDHDYSRMTM